MEWVALLLFLSVILLLLAGFPVAFSLGGTALLFALVGTVGGGFEEAFLTSIPSRIFGIMSNERNNRSASRFRGWPCYCAPRK